MPPLRRHQLVRLTDEGWRAVCAQSWDADAQGCVAHWAAQRLPLVVTRQPGNVAGDRAGMVRNLALGLAAPLRWQRRRLALSVELGHVAWVEEFPAALDLAPLLPLRARPAWRRLCMALVSLGTTARVYGGHGWQRLTGLRYLHAGSDIDLWTAVSDAEQADAVAAVLGAFDATLPRRLDGELLFPDGRAFAWREWQAWRAGRTRAILCKTLHGASLLWSSAAEDAAPNVATKALP